LEHKVYEETMVELQELKKRHPAVKRQLGKRNLLENNRGTTSVGGRRTRRKNKKSKKTRKH